MKLIKTKNKMNVKTFIIGESIGSFDKPILPRKVFFNVTKIAKQNIDKVNILFS